MGQFETVHTRFFWHMYNVSYMYASKRSVILPELDGSAVLFLLFPADILQPTVKLLDLPKQRCTVSRVELV